MHRAAHVVITVVLTLIIIVQLWQVAEPESVAVASPFSTTRSTAPSTRLAEVLAHPRNTTLGTQPPQFAAPFGYNPDRCLVQPNRTPIPKYTGCPLPGLNNLLYTQINRWYCAVRDNVTIRLRDRTCNRDGIDEPFRFSTIVQVNYSQVQRTLPSHNAAAICWCDISRQDTLRECEWKHVKYFYGNSLWWQARRAIDFHQVYYALASVFIDQFLGGKPFISIHLRRGDYEVHCKMLYRRGTSPWITFRSTKKLYGVMEGCYPSMDTVKRTIRMLRKSTTIDTVFVATNRPNVIAEAGFGKNVVTLPRSFFDRFMPGSRMVDRIIVEMAVLSMGSFFVLNRFSSFSAMVYEMAMIHDRIQNSSTAVCW